MGTRGAIGVYVDGVTKAAYNQFDMYPDGHGQQVVNEIKELLETYSLEELRAKAAAMVAIDKKTTPTDEQKTKLAPYYASRVSSQSTDDWYCLFREMQGGIKTYLEVGMMLDQAVFLADSLFCEYAYILNLDDNLFEIYEGFRTTPPLGRYASLPYEQAHRGENQYYPVSLVSAFPLDNIPENWKELSFPERYEKD